MGLQYIKWQFYLLGDLCNNNEICLKKIMHTCPPYALIHCLQLEDTSATDQNMEIKAGFARIIYSLFANIEKCFTKPKLERLISASEKSEFINKSKFFRGKEEMMKLLKNSAAQYLANKISKSAEGLFDTGEMEFDFELIRIISTFMRADIIFYPSYLQGFESVKKTFNYCSYFLEKYISQKDTFKLSKNRTQLSSQLSLGNEEAEEEKYDLDDEEKKDDDDEQEEVEEFSLEKLENAAVPYYGIV